nr:hypothetical protein [Tanacetum cinerariifolium]
MICDLTHIKNLNLLYKDIGTSSTGRHLTQEEASKEALTIRISQKFSLLEEVRPVLETMAYHNKYKKVLDEIWKDKVELYGMIVKDEEKEIKKVKGEALKEKDDPRAFIFPIRLESQLMKIHEEKEIKKVKGEALKEKDDPRAFIFPIRLESQVGVTTLIAKFQILDIPIDRDAPIVEGCNRDAKSRYNTKLDQLLHRHIYSPCVVNWDVLNKMRCDGEIDDMLRIKLREAGSNEEIFTSVAWIRAFSINEPIYSKLCHEFYSTYEFDKVCADDELQTKKIIKFRLGGRAHNLTLLEFARRLGLYHTDELDEEGFNVYFKGGLRSDEHFNAQENWSSISRVDNISLSRRHTSTIQSLVSRVIHKMITYGLCQRTTGLVDCEVDKEKRIQYSEGKSNLLWTVYHEDY